jgi:DNA polymerase-3 subunit chi
MTQVDFYHLSQSDLETALMMLLKKTIAAGKTGLILCPKPAAAALDAALWSHDPASWLAHGVDDAAGSDIAPLWISTDPATNPIKAPFAFLVHGQEPESLDGFERVFNLFDGRSDAQITGARAQWKAWGGNAGLALSYYAQGDDGRWQKNA